MTVETTKASRDQVTLLSQVLGSILGRQTSVGCAWRLKPKEPKETEELKESLRAGVWGRGRVVELRTRRQAVELRKDLTANVKDLRIHCAFLTLA